MGENLPLLCVTWNELSELPTHTAQRILATTIGTGRKRNYETRTNMRVIYSIALLLLFTITITRADEDTVNGHGRHHPVPLDPQGSDDSSTEKRTTAMRATSPNMARSMYNIPGGDNAGAGQTVAVVVAYGASTAESDLASFSTRYGLPPCTSDNGCFKKVDQNGGSNIPRDDTGGAAGWGGETALDVQWVHAVAPAANIILVCANSSLSSNLFPAVRTAASLANIVSLSWGAAESGVPQTAMEAYLATLRGRISFFAATGDDGRLSGYPASSPSVIAVGGTSTYTNSDGTLEYEEGWEGSAGGCSKTYTATTPQMSSGSGSLCGQKRATPDISFNADPNSGVPIFYNGTWYQFGGTSLACPIAAGRAAAVMGSNENIRVIDAQHIYNNAVVRDVALGYNYNYSATVGFDLVTGKGVWIGDTDASSPVGPTPTTPSTLNTPTSSVISTSASSTTSTTSTPVSTSTTSISCQQMWSDLPCRTLYEDPTKMNPTALNSARDWLCSQENGRYCQDIQGSGKWSQCNAAEQLSYAMSLFYADHVTSQGDAACSFGGIGVVVLPSTWSASSTTSLPSTSSRKKTSSVAERSGSSTSELTTNDLSTSPPISRIQDSNSGVNVLTLSTITLSLYSCEPVGCTDETV
ncbi:lipoprotein [Planoprotostelium fungivorum]|uniref:Lipoprotein n=1 Tax=Planoprotostelium fungivorum TaxID=1890364 RepID=A0A2P6NK61_9EUKA|nr:lipoprotein [Planoprotostelium fungivorum]